MRHNIRMGYIDENGKTKEKIISIKEAFYLVANGNFHFERIVGSNIDILINEDETQWFIFESLH